MKPYALVTGASSGIGLQYATVLAEKYHYNLLLVSNQAKELQAVSNDLNTRFGVETLCRCQDLSQETAADELHDFCIHNHLEIEVLVNNAGVFFFNELRKTDTPIINRMLHLHIGTLTHLCKLFGGDMAERGHGYILNMSSMSAWMAMPGISTYNATKAYILNFSRSLWYELHPYGVGVTVICPGAVDTGLYGLRDDLRRLAVNLQVSIPPRRLAEVALKKMFKRKKQVMPGLLNHLFVPIIKHLPDWVVFFAMRRLAQFQR